MKMLENIYPTLHPISSSSSAFLLLSAVLAATFPWNCAVNLHIIML